LRLIWPVVYEAQVLLIKSLNGFLPVYSLVFETERSAAECTHSFGTA